MENKEKVEKYTLDLYYTTHFPLTEKYIALYPKSEIESEEVLKKRQRIRLELREEMIHGKKKISGSNEVKLGKPKVRNQKEEEAASGEESDDNDDSKMVEVDSDEDVYLDLGHKKRS